MPKVELKLSNPYRDPVTGKVTETGETISVDAGDAPRLVTGGTAVYVRKADAPEAPRVK